MVTGCDAGGGPNSLTEGLPETGGKLGPSVRDDVYRKSVQLKNMVHQQVRCLLGRWEFGENNKMNHLGEAVHNS